MDQAANDVDSGVLEDDSSQFFCEASYCEQTHYEVLELDSTATTEDIKSAWRRLAKDSHPDKNASNSTSYFQRILEAYSTLSDETLRKKYDECLSVKITPGSNHDRLPSIMSPPIVTSIGASVIVEWSVDSEEERQNIDSFVLEIKKDGSGVQQAYEGTCSSVRITGLIKGWNYFFRVRAVNTLGSGEVSEFKNFVPPFADDSGAQSPRTQQFVNNLHVAISTRNMAVLECLLERKGDFDLSNFAALLALAKETASTSHHLQYIPENNNFPAPMSRHHHHPPQNAQNFSPRMPKSLL